MGHLQLFLMSRQAHGLLLHCLARPLLNASLRVAVEHVCAILHDSVPLGVKHRSAVLILLLEQQAADCPTGLGSYPVSVLAEALGALNLPFLGGQIIQRILVHLSSALCKQAPKLLE